MAAVTRTKKRLGTFLRQRREGAGWSTVRVGEVLKTSDSTVSRYESGQVLPQWSVVLNMLNIYECTQAQVATAVDLWEKARIEPPLVRLPKTTPRGFRQLIAAEAEGVRVRTIACLTMPGLTQHEEYARALFEAGHRFRNPSDSIDDAMRVRLRRQERISPDHDDPLEYEALIDEAVILRKTGGARVMRLQLERLLALGEQSNVKIQIIPFKLGAYGASAGGCFIVDYADENEHPGVYLEYPTGGVWVAEQDVRKFTAMYDDTARAALAPADSADLIRDHLKGLR